MNHPLFFFFIFSLHLRCFSISASQKTSSISSSDWAVHSLPPVPTAWSWKVPVYQSAFPFPPWFFSASFLQPDSASSFWLSQFPYSALHSDAASLWPCVRNARDSAPNDFLLSKRGMELLAIKRANACRRIGKCRKSGDAANGNEAWKSKKELFFTVWSCRRTSYLWPWSFPNGFQLFLRCFVM